MQPLVVTRHLQMGDRYPEILEARLAVGDPQQHPELTGRVKSVDTRDSWRSVEKSPANQGYHYNRNAETSLLVGDALDRALMELLDKKEQGACLPSRVRLRGSLALRVGRRVQFHQLSRLRAQST